MTNAVKQVLIIASVVLLVACGYHFAGSGRFPGGVRHIYITMLKNRTSETGVESRFTNDLIYEFTRNREAAVADNRESADAILTGTIVSLAVQNISLATIDTAIERRVIGTVDLRLARPDGQLIWSSGNIVDQEDYMVVSGNKTATDQNKSDAIAELSKKIAEAAFNRLTDNF